MYLIPVAEAFVVVAGTAPFKEAGVATTTPKDCRVGG
jgi:hypothetical protein